MTVRLRIDARFERAFRKLTRDQQRKATEALAKFAGNPARPGLNLEAVGSKPGFYSIRVTRGWRILLRREADENGDLFTAVAIGPHDIYRTL